MFVGMGQRLLMPGAKDPKSRRVGIRCLGMMSAMPPVGVGMVRVVAVLCMTGRVLSVVVLAGMVMATVKMLSRVVQLVGHRHLKPPAMQMQAAPVPAMGMEMGHNQRHAQAAQDQHIAGFMAST